jgi:hypothetical protein
LSKPHKPKLKPKLAKELAKPAHVAKGIFAIAQKNKINLCFVDKLVQFDRD